MTISNHLKQFSLWMIVFSLFTGFASSQKLTELVDQLIPEFPSALDGEEEGSETEEVVLSEEEPVFIEEYDDKFVLNDAPLNTVFQFLADEADLQYFHNAKYADAQFNVTGSLNTGDPIQQMKDLAFLHGINIIIKGNTIYAFSDSQMSNVPTEEWYYQLRYLRPQDIDQVKLLIRPFLSDTSTGKSIVNYEEKTNTLIVIDKPGNLKKIKEVMEKIDQPKKQIAVEVKILRVNANNGRFRGVDWSSSLGQAGVPVTVGRSLTDLFNLNDNTISSASSSGLDINGITETGTSGLVLSPFQVNGVLRALNDQNLSQEISNPTVITEDNESASISIIDRIPIITTTATIGNGITNNAEEVRYKIDETDPTVTEDPEKTREIGITISVTPVTLPDGTIRMKLRPRSAQITEFIQGELNSYPRVSEATVEAIARVPNGHSLILGGFYGDSLNKIKNDVPLLGKIPGLSMLFKSEQTANEKTSLVFIVTPKNYDPSVISENSKAYYDNYEALTFEEADEALAPATQYSAKDQEVDVPPYREEKIRRRGFFSKFQSTPAQRQRRYKHRKF